MNGVLFLIYYFKDILPHFEFVNWEFVVSFFDATNRLYIQDCDGITTNSTFYSVKPGNEF